MGYIENCLPKALAAMGHDVSLITSTAQVYFNQPHYKTSFEDFLGAPIQPEGMKIIDGVKVCRLPFHSLKKQLIIKGLVAKIREIKPDIVHTFVHADVNTLKLVFAKIFTPYKLFTANHTSLLAFEVSKKENNANNWYHTLLRFLIFTLPGAFISLFIKKCFCVTVDAIGVATQIYGVKKSKAIATTLGVDTELFRPNDIVKKSLREKLGFQPTDIVCIYTGKLTLLKNPLILAQAIDKLRHSEPRFKGLFIGNGEQHKAIEDLKNCTILPFQQHKDLPQYYQMADIAVWPFGESSSQIDVVATGLCLVLSEGVKTYDSVNSASKFTETEVYFPKIVSRFYKTNDVEDLTEALKALKFREERESLIALGMKEVRDIFSWESIATRRLKDYTDS
ncbi:MAG: glycosyltransferase family 4 protein [Saprospiraceae bacterium]|nr:glycosyltransferase family 4 protein [Saprospiraceae bacterium]